MIVEIPMDSAKLKFSQIILPEGDVSWDNEVDIVLILLLHLDNPPCSHVLMTHGVLLAFRLHTPDDYNGPLCDDDHPNNARNL